MICEKCHAEGKKSRVFEGPQTMTLSHVQPYYDEDGNYVMPPDPNTYTTSYYCSNGHNWVVTRGPERGSHASTENEAGKSSDGQGIGGQSSLV